MMINAINIALSGLNAATKQVEASAKNIAEGPSDNLIQDAVDIKLAEMLFAANALVIKAAQEISQTSQNIFDKKV